MTACTLLFALTLTFSPIHATWAVQGRNLIVWFAVTDSWTITEAHNRAMQKSALNFNPGHEIVQIKVNAASRIFSEEAIRASLLKQVQALKLNPEDRITHIVFTGHSGTSQDGTRSHFKYLGDWNAEGPDESLRPLLEPLRGYTAPDLVVVQNGCSTLCGTPEQIDSRSRGLLEYFHAPHGQIYGAVVAESAAPVFPAMGIAFTTAVSFGLYKAFGQVNNEVVFGAGVSLLMSATFTFSRVVGTTIGLFNFGRILRYRDGVLSESTLIAKAPNLEAVYTRNACAEALGDGTSVLPVDVLE